MTKKCEISLTVPRMKLFNSFRVRLMEVTLRFNTGQFIIDSHRYFF